MKEVKEIKRLEAIEDITEKLLCNLSKNEREDLLYNYWSDINNKLIEDNIVLKDEIDSNSYPIDSSENKKYDLIIKFGLTSTLKGMKNSYLQKLYMKYFHIEINIIGQEEYLEVCPCCKYRTIKDRGAFEICPVCFWEDSGTDDLSSGFPPNKISLGEAQENFKIFGASEKSLIEYVDKDGKEKYIKA